MTRKIGELVVKPRQSPKLKLFVAAVLVLVIIGTGGAIYNHGLSTAGFDRLAVSRHQQDLLDQIHKLKAENQDLRDSLARAQLALQMDQTAYAELDGSLKSSAQEINKLREELSFYRNIISPANKISGLQIQRLDVLRTSADNQFNYKLVLIQALKHDHLVGGHVRLEIQGEQNGGVAVVNIPAAGEKPMQVSFRYFQDVEGTFKLAPTFKPLRVKVTVATGGGSPIAEQTYPWPRV